MGQCCGTEQLKPQRVYPTKETSCEDGILASSDEPIIYPPTTLGWAGAAPETPRPMPPPASASAEGAGPEGGAAALAVDDVMLALYDFEARSDQELSFRAQDKIVVIQLTEDPAWLYVRHEASGAVGFIPSNYVTNFQPLNTYDWFFGYITRREAEGLLSRMQEGVFLIRYSTTTEGCYALSLKHAREDRNVNVLHYIVRWKPDISKFAIWDKNFYDSLPDLIEKHKETTNGFPILLNSACPRIPPAMSELSVETRGDKFEIDRDEITVSDVMLGSGYFGEVHRGVWKGETEIAIKRLKKGTMTRNAFLEEAKIMKGLKHKNILGLLATCSDEEPIYIITQFMSNGSLKDVLKGAKAKESLTLDQMLEFSFQISQGMQYLEQRKLIHRDLAARNVLVDDQYVCKIADFGLARLLGPKGYSITNGKFPIKWSPPEVLSNSKFSDKSDVYSFGIVMIEIFTYGDTIYPGMPQKQIREEVLNGLRPSKPPTCPDYIYEVLLKCWDFNPTARPSFSDLRGHLEDTTQNNRRNQQPTRYLTSTAYHQMVEIAHQEKQQ